MRCMCFAVMWQIPWDASVWNTIFHDNGVGSLQHW